MYSKNQKRWHYSAAGWHLCNGMVGNVTYFYACWCFRCDSHCI